MHKCMTEGCNNQIDNQYKFCISCVNKMKQANVQTGAVVSAGDSAVADLLSKINSNLYALRTIEEYKLGIDYRAELKTNPESKRLEVVKKMKARK
jgi:hypothetical protein